MISFSKKEWFVIKTALRLKHGTPFGPKFLCDKYYNQIKDRPPTERNAMITTLNLVNKKLAAAGHRKLFRRLTPVGRKNLALFDLDYEVADLVRELVK
jgi:hypothetical protein